MRMPLAFRWLVLGAITLLGAAPASFHSHYLFVWAMEARHPDASTAASVGLGKDFLVVFDVAPDAPAFGKLVAMLPVGNGAKQAHHTSYALQPNGVLFDMMGAQKSRVVQVWRLSDLKLLKTIVLPQASDWFADDAADASEPRVLADGETVAVPTFHCGLYLLRDLAGNPTLKHVYDFGYRVCEVPIVVGNYLVETMQSGHAIVSLDMHVPSHPREVGRILLKPDEDPHWLAIEPGGDRIVITGPGARETRLDYLAAFDHDLRVVQGFDVGSGVAIEQHQVGVFADRDDAAV
jgi:hypothetical protein